VENGFQEAPSVERPSWGSPLVNVQESAARYAFVAPRVRGSRVLDVACGSGLGSHFLATRGARFVIGVERSAEALDEPRMRSLLGEARFVRADALALPFFDAAVDVVVSFETIEHVDDPRRFARECRRVLRRGGRFYLSTPNRGVTQWLPPNPFHLREFTQSELIEMIGEYFSQVQCFWQRPVFFPVFLVRQMGRRWLQSLPGGRRLWAVWKAVRPRRIRLGATAWQGTVFDESLLDVPYYRVTAARRLPFLKPTWTVLVATC